MKASSKPHVSYVRLRGHNIKTIYPGKDYGDTDSDTDTDTKPNQTMTIALFSDPKDIAKWFEVFYLLQKVSQEEW